MIEFEMSTRKISKHLNIAYNTAHKAVMLVRYAILADTDPHLLLSGQIELDESYFGGMKKGRRGRGARNKIPVFGILERNGKVSVNVVPDVRADTLLGETVMKVKRGSLVYTSQVQVL